MDPKSDVPFTTDFWGANWAEMFKLSPVIAEQGPLVLSALRGKAALRSRLPPCAPASGPPALTKALPGERHSQALDQPMGCHTRAATPLHSSAAD